MRAVCGVGDERRDGLLQDGMMEIGSEFGERDEDEAALVHARVRDFEVAGADARGGVEQDIDIDFARGALGGAAAASEGVFDAVAIVSEPFTVAYVVEEVIDMALLVGFASAVAVMVTR